MSDHVRLLLCHEDKTLEQVEDYEGDPHNDWALKYVLEKHRYPSGDPHLGQMLRVEKKHWDLPSTREAIEKQIRDSAGHTGLDQSFYDTKDTLGEDALKCFEKHGRNPGCSNYRDEDKRLSAGTDRERKSLGLQPLRSNHFLCDHCPVHSMVMAHKNRNL
ncbi:hypothetical protein [Terracoccus sp. 273MFTsu3.1]|uniref:hypothetical protein n=1 Tax=Terracoccus sp. 273MFTsu3.1 TaxID=1172188 RepID=UPI0003808C7B|nr:hypothetical protein [Terracoccus sp. 273MFTsu3.1]